TTSSKLARNPSCRCPTVGLSELIISTALPEICSVPRRGLEFVTLGRLEVTNISSPFSKSTDSISTGTSPGVGLLLPVGLTCSKRSDPILYCTFSILILFSLPVTTTVCAAAKFAKASSQSAKINPTGYRQYQDGEVNCSRYCFIC